jgi:predicted transcriptional regulator
VDVEVLASATHSGQTKKNGYFRVPDALFDLHLSAHAKLVYANLCRRVGRTNPFPSHKRIAEDCSCSVATVKRALRELVKATLVTVQTHGHAGKSNYYYLNTFDSINIAQTELCDTAHTELSHSSDRAIDIAHTERQRATQKRATQEGRAATEAQRKRAGTAALKGKEAGEEGRLVRSWYAAIDVEVPAQRIAAECSVVAELLKRYSVTDFNAAVDYVRRNPLDVHGNPIRSIKFLTYIIEDARKEAKQKTNASGRRKQIEEAERKLQEQATQEAVQGLSNETMAKMPPGFRKIVAKVARKMGSGIKEIKEYREEL